MFKRIAITASYMLSVTLAYLLMLIVMTYNGVLFIATILGLGFGHFVFAFPPKKNDTYSAIYNLAPEPDN